MRVTHNFVLNKAASGFKLWVQHGLSEGPSARGRKPKSSGLDVAGLEESGEAEPAVVGSDVHPSQAAPSRGAGWLEEDAVWETRRVLHKGRGDRPWERA